MLVTFLALLSGLLAILLLTILFRKHSLPIILLIIMESLLTFSVVSILSLEYSFVNETFLGEAGRNFFFYGLIFVDIILLFAFPVFNHGFLDHPRKKLLNIIWASITVINLGIFFYQLSLGNINIEYLNRYPYHYVIFDLMFVYIIFTLIFKLSKTKDPEMKLYIKFYMMGIAFLLIVSILNYMGISPRQFFPDSEPMIKFLIRFYGSRIVFMIGGNLFLCILIAKHATVKPFFMLPEEYKFLEEFPLTRREQEIVALLSDGLTNREVGHQLFISEFTVKTHVKNIYSKLAVKNRVELSNLIQKHLSSKH